MAKETKKAEDRVCDLASIETLIKAERDCVQTCFTRMDTQQKQCRF